MVGLEPEFSNGCDQNVVAVQIDGHVVEYLSVWTTPRSSDPRSFAS